jgi:CheY-like chemotaxis protein
MMGASVMARGKDILVLDEDPFMHELVSLWLTDAGYAVCDCEALRALRTEEHRSFAVVIADLNSPKVGAAQALRQLQARFPTAYIIAISGYFQPGPGTGTEMARQLGVDRVLAKPFSCEQLVSAVGGLFHDADVR